MLYIDYVVETWLIKTKYLNDTLVIVFYKNLSGRRLLIRCKRHLVVDTEHH